MALYLAAASDEHCSMERCAGKSRSSFSAHCGTFFCKSCRAVICRKANEYGLPLEINMLGLGTGRPYPYRKFWEMAASEGCTAIIGCDAHNPEDVFHQELIDAGRALAADCGIKVIDTLPLKYPFA